MSRLLHQNQHQPQYLSTSSLNNICSPPHLLELPSRQQQSDLRPILPGTISPNPDCLAQTEGPSNDLGPQQISTLHQETCHPILSRCCPSGMNQSLLRTIPRRAVSERLGTSSKFLARYFQLSLRNSPISLAVLSSGVTISVFHDGGAQFNRLFLLCYWRYTGSLHSA